MAGGAASRPNHNHHSPAQMADGHRPNLAVVKPVVVHRHRVAGKHLPGVNREIETPVCEGSVALGGIKGSFH